MLNPPISSGSVVALKPKVEDSDATESLETIPDSPSRTATQTVTPPEMSSLGAETTITPTQNESSSHQQESLAQVAKPVLRGPYKIEGSVALWEGDWGMSLSAFSTPGQTSKFSYRSKAATQSLKPPLSGLYDGFFFLQVPNGAPQKVIENSVIINFIDDPSNPTIYKAFGEGSNRFGSFELNGAFDSTTESLTLTKVYKPTPKPARKTTRGRANVVKKPAAATRPKALPSETVSAQVGGAAQPLSLSASKVNASTPAATPAKRRGSIKSLPHTASENIGDSSEMLSPRSRSERKRVAPSYLREDEDTPIFKLPDQMKKVKALLLQLMRHQYAHPFLEPVDPVALNIPDYFTIIRSPMDLGTIQKNLENGDYGTPDDIADHVRLTFRNARTYNKPKHAVHEWAKQLEEMWESKYSDIVTRQTSNFVPTQPVSAGKAPRTKKAKRDELSLPVTKSVKGGDGAVSANTLKRRRSSVKPARTSIASETSEIESMKEQIEMMKKQIEMMKAAGLAAAAGLSQSTSRPSVSPTPSITDETKPLTFEEKRKLSLDINRLPAEKLTRILQIISERMPIHKQNTDQEIEIDIGSLDTLTLRDLQQYVKNCFTTKRKRSSKSSPKAPGSQLELAQKVAQAHQHQIQKVQAQLEALEKGQLHDPLTPAVQPEVEVKKGVSSSSEGSSSDSDSSSSSGSESDDEDSGSESDDDKRPAPSPVSSVAAQEANLSPKAESTIEVRSDTSNFIASKMQIQSDPQFCNLNAWSSLLSPDGKPERKSQESGALWTAVRQAEQRKLQRDKEVAQEELRLETHRQQQKQEVLEELMKQRIKHEAKMELEKQKQLTKKREQVINLEQKREAERAKRELSHQDVNLEEQQLMISSMEKQFESSSFRKNSMQDFD